VPGGGGSFCSFSGVLGGSGRSSSSRNSSESRALMRANSFSLSSPCSYNSSKSASWSVAYGGSWLDRFRHRSRRAMITPPTTSAAARISVAQSSRVSQSRGPGRTGTAANTCQTPPTIDASPRLGLAGPDPSASAAALLRSCSIIARLCRTRPQSPLCRRALALPPHHKGDIMRHLRLANLFGTG